MSSSAPPPTTLAPEPRAAIPQSLRQFAPWLVVLGAASLTGALTPIGEHVLPHSIRSMANSSGPWMLIDFASIYLVRARGWLAAVLGAASFLVMDVVFFVVFEALGDHYPKENLAFWGVIAVAIGPVVGIAASWLRSRSVRLRAVAIAAPASVLFGEGVYLLVAIPGESTVYAIASVVVSVGLFAVLAWREVRPARVVAASAALTVVGAGAFFAIYSLLPLLFGKVVP
ncbi:MAG TPA: DUF6518 family protein [Galbitalea sp.]|jgi:hypothetical protein